MFPPYFPPLWGALNLTPTYLVLIVPQTVLDCRGSDGLLGVVLVPEIRIKMPASFCAQASQTVMVTPSNLKRNGYVFFISVEKNTYDLTHF